MDTALECASLPGVCLERANLSGAFILTTDLHGADLRKADLSEAHVLGTNLQGANLCGASARSASFTGADLRDADLTGADLTKASMTPWDRNPHPELRDQMPSELRDQLPPEQPPVSPNLAGADLTRAILIGADLGDANLTGAKWTGAICDARTRWPEGFDPQRHGVETLPMSTEWLLRHEEVVLGRLRNCRPDHSRRTPAFRCYFAPTAAFDRVRPLFDEDAALIKARRFEEAMNSYYAAIDPLGLRLESPTGDVIDSLRIHIDGEEACFCY